MPTPTNIKDISADLLPAEMFLYPVCTTREGFSAMLEAMDNYYKKQHERVEVIKDFLNAQEYVGNPLDQPCVKELVDELIASLPPDVRYRPSECELEECDEMACNCDKNPVRFCPDTGKMEYKNTDGVWVDVPASAIPDEANDGLPVGTQANADCWKANGLWDAFAAFTNALMDVITDDTVTRNPASWSAKFTADYPSLYAVQSALTNTFFNSILEIDTLAEAEALQDEWQAEIEAYRFVFICEALGYVSKEALLSTSEVIYYRTRAISGFSAGLEALLEDLRAVPTSASLQTFVNNRVLGKSGSCPCNDDGTPVLEFESGCGIINFVAFGGQNMGGWNLNTFNPTEVLAATPKWGAVLGSGIKSNMLLTAEPNQQFGFVAMFEQIGDADWKIASVTATFTRGGALAFVAQDVSTFSALNTTTDFVQIARETTNSVPQTLAGSVSNPAMKFVAVAGSIAMEDGDASAYISAAITFYVYRTSAPATLYPVTFGVQFC